MVMVECEQMGVEHYGLLIHGIANIDVVARVTGNAL